VPYPPFSFLGPIFCKEIGWDHRGTRGKRDKEISRDHIGCPQQEVNRMDKPDALAVTDLGKVIPLFRVRPLALEAPRQVIADCHCGDCENARRLEKMLDEID